MSPRDIPLTPAFADVVEAITWASRCAGVASAAPSSTCASAAALEGVSSPAARVETAIDATSGRLTCSPRSAR